MNQQSQHVIPKKLNKEKFLASRENYVVSVLTQIVSGLNARGAIYWFVANFMKIVWKLSKTCFPPRLEGVMMWHVSNFFSEFSNFQRIRNLSKKGFPPRLEGVMMQHVSNSFSKFRNFQQSKVRQKKVFRLDLRGDDVTCFSHCFSKSTKKTCTSELAATHSLVSRFNCCLWFLNHHLFQFWLLLVHNSDLVKSWRLQCFLPKNV